MTRPDEDAAIDSAVLAHLRERQDLIGAVKLVRERSGMSLKDAVDRVHRVAAAAGLTEFRKPGLVSRLVGAILLLALFIGAVLLVAMMLR